MSTLSPHKGWRRVAGSAVLALPAPQPLETKRRPDADGRAALQFREMSAIFEQYAVRTPLSYALFRSAECRELRRVSVPRPTLDLGCGAGEFAAFSLRPDSVANACDLGIDLRFDRLARAQRRGAHASLAQADAHRLPFANESFASVVAVSVYEHFACPSRALAETYRVLRPRGRFVATIVLLDIHEYLFYPRLCERLRLPWVSRWYHRLHDRLFHHTALQEKQHWEKMLVDVGFEIVESRKIVPPRLTRCFDFWLITASLYRLMQCLRLVPVVWRPKWMTKLCWRWFLEFVGDEPENGSTLLIVADKPPTPVSPSMVVMPRTRHREVRNTQ